MKDVKTREGLLYVRAGKNQHRRVIPLSKKVAKDLKVYLYRERPIWCTDHRLGSLDSLQSFMFNKHGSRLQGGMRLEQVKDLLGHQSVESTQIYTHVSTEALAKMYQQLS